MEIVLVRPLGYCHGMRRSLRSVEETLEAEREEQDAAGAEVRQWLEALARRKREMG
jgi:4-hydroxy-3-methylbut-2-enyl diphosphate reductase IspH